MNNSPNGQKAEVVMNKDLLNRVLKWVDHNRWTAIAACIILVLGITTFGTIGCKSTTMGFSGVKVDRATFAREVVNENKNFIVAKIELDKAIEAYNADVLAHNELVESGVADLDEQDAIKAQILTTAGEILGEVAAGTLNPASLIPTGIGAIGLLLGGGVYADNRRKDKVITGLKPAPTS